MKRHVLFLWLMSASVVSYSQIVERLSSQSAGLAKSPNLYGFFTKGKDGIFKGETIEKGKQKIYVLKRYNADLSEGFTQQIPYEEKEEFDMLDVKQNKILFFTTLYDGKDKAIFLRVLDYGTGKTITARQQLASLPSDPFGTGGRNFPVVFSPDETKMLLVSSFQWAKKPQDVKADVYDLSSLKVTSRFSFDAEQNGAMIKTGAYTLTDMGNVIFTARTDSKEKNAETKVMLGMYSSASKSISYTDLPFDKKKTENTHYFLKNGNFYYTGLFRDNYSKKDDKENKAGMFCIVADSKTMKVVSSELNYFSTDIETKLTYKDGKKRRDLSEKEITDKGVFQTDDGFYLVENLTYTAEATAGNTTVYNPFSREFIVNKFNNAGKLEFAKVLPKNASKKMYGEDIMESNGSLFFFYCDHPKNLEKYSVENFDPKDYNDIGDLRGPTAVCVKVDAKGNLSREELLNNETWCYWPGSGVVLKKGKEIAVMEIQKDEYVLSVYRINGK